MTHMIAVRQEHGFLLSVTKRAAFLLSNILTTSQMTSLGRCVPSKLGTRKSRTSFALSYSPIVVSSIVWNTTHNQNSLCSCLSYQMCKQRKPTSMAQLHWNRDRKQNGRDDRPILSNRHACEGSEASLQRAYSSGPRCEWSLRLEPGTERIQGEEILKHMHMKKGIGPLNNRARPRFQGCAEFAARLGLAAASLVAAMVCAVLRSRAGAGRGTRRASGAAPLRVAHRFVADAFRRDPQQQALPSDIRQCCSLGCRQSTTATHMHACTDRHTERRSMPLSPFSVLPVPLPEPAPPSLPLPLPPPRPTLPLHRLSLPSIQPTSIQRRTWSGADDSSHSPQIRSTPSMKADSV